MNKELEYTIDSTQQPPPRYMGKKAVIRDAISRAVVGECVVIPNIEKRAVASIRSTLGQCAKQAGKKIITRSIPGSGSLFTLRAWITHNNA